MQRNYFVAFALSPDLSTFGRDFKAKKLISQIGFSLLFCCVGDFCCFCWPGPCRGSAAFFSCLPIGHSARGSQAPLAPWPGDGPQA